MVLLKKLAPKGSFILVVFAFLLPFLLVKCEGQTIAKVSGTDLVIGSDVSTDLGRDSGESKSEPIDPEPYAIAALLIAIVGIVISFNKKYSSKKIIPLFLGILGMVSLVLLYMDLNINNIEDELSAGDGDLKVNLSIGLGMGYYLAFIGFLMATVVNAILLKQKE